MSHRPYPPYRSLADVAALLFVAIAMQPYALAWRIDRPGDRA